MAFEDSDIYQAILDGDLGALGFSVGEEGEVRARDRAGRSYLHVCVELGQQELVEFLAKRVCLGFRDHNGDTVLDLATRYRMKEVEHQLIRHVAGLQDSDDTEALYQLFQLGWHAWPPIHPHYSQTSDGYNCQQHILSLQTQVDVIHMAVYNGQLARLQQAITEPQLVLASDHTGLPPLQKAVLFEWLSVVQYLSREFPAAVNHPDHMGRTALHYAAAYHEYQDNILYKQLLRAGASVDVSDLQGYKPTDYLLDGDLFSIDHMREEIKSRLSRPRKDYCSDLSYEDSRSSAPAHAPSTGNPSIKRWRAMASVASFASNSRRKLSRQKAFEETVLYESIITNDVYSVRYLLGQGEDVNRHSLEGWSYLHLAVAHNVSPALLSLLLTQLSPAERDCEGRTPLELSLHTHKNPSLSQTQLDVVVGRVIAGDVTALQGLVQDGWQFWPDDNYMDVHLQPHITPDMMQFLSTVKPFLTEVRELHTAAMLHQEVDSSLCPLLDSETAVTTLNSAGLPLPHVCVLFYNIKLLNHLLQAWPFTANLKDSVGRTPLHYAACLDDDDYMFTLLRSAKARDDEEDLWGKRPGDYRENRHTIVSPTIQEMLRDKIYHSTELQPPWPTCLLSARMEGSKILEAIKTGDLATLQTLHADPACDFSQRDSHGHTFLHQALLSAAPLPIIQLLLHTVDIAVRDEDCDTVMDLALSGVHPQSVKEALEERVGELIGGRWGEGFAATEQGGGREGDGDTKDASERKPLGGRRREEGEGDGYTVKGRGREGGDWDDQRAEKWREQGERDDRGRQQGNEDGENTEERGRDLIGQDQAGEEETERLLLAGWTHWPSSLQHIRHTSRTSLLNYITHTKEKISRVHRAVEEGLVQDLHHLVDTQLLANAADHTGLPPLHKAVLCQHSHVVCYFISSFTTTLITTDNMGRTALHYAAALDDGGALYRTLIHAGADQRATDLKGKIPYDYKQQPDLLIITGSQQKTKDLSASKITMKKGKRVIPYKTAQSTFSAHPSQLLAQERPQPASKGALNTVSQPAPFPSTPDSQYIARHLGSTLTAALADIVRKQPSDPIEYLAHWLYHYRQHQGSTAQQGTEVKDAVEPLEVSD